MVIVHCRLAPELSIVHAVALRAVALADYLLEIRIVWLDDLLLEVKSLASNVRRRVCQDLALQVDQLLLRGIALHRYLSVATLHSALFPGDTNDLLVAQLSLAKTLVHLAFIQIWLEVVRIFIYISLWNLQA